MSLDSDFPKDKVPIEVALNRAGFGLYSYILTSFAGVAIISFVCIGYGSSILVPTSACELRTTPAQQGLLAAAPVVGSIIGTVIWGYLADTRGRRSMLLTSFLLGGVVNSVASISVNWIMLMILQFIASLLVSGLFSMSMSILSESVPQAKRNLVVLLVTSIFLLAQGLMSVLAIPIIPLTFSYYLPALGIYWNSWRTLMVVYSLPSLLSALWIFLMKESPQFVYSKGDIDGALDILRTIHRVNHLWSKEELPVTGLLSQHLGQDNLPSEKTSQIIPLFKQPLLKFTIIMSILYLFQQVGAFLVWLPRIADQFVSIIQTGEGTNLTLCGILGSSLQIPEDPNAVPCALNETALLIVLGVAALHSIVNLLFSLIVNSVGRRNLVMVITATCGVSGILVNLIPNAYGSVVFFTVQLAGIIVMGMYTAICVALFPTHLRAISIAIPMTAGRISTFASIQILNIMLINNCEAGFYLFASIYASSAIVASFLPDDRRLKPAPVKKESVVENAPVLSENSRSPPSRNLND